MGLSFGTPETLQTGGPRTTQDTLRPVEVRFCLEGQFGSRGFRGLELEISDVGLAFRFRALGVWSLGFQASRCRG